MPRLSRPRTRSRPRTLLGLLAHVVQLHVWRLTLVGALLAVGTVVTSRCERQPGPAVGTFNIENFPRGGPRQVAGAFETLARLGGPVWAVQEITAPARFRREAQARLGPAWRFVHDGSRNQQRVGVLYDSDRYALAWSRDRRETLIDGRHKVSLDVRLRSREGGPALRLFVVHLKAGGEWPEVRRQQLRQLAPVVREAAESWDEVMVLGDFNATGAADRETLAWFASATGLHWASEALLCTSYWNRRDGCLGTPLDHVFTRRAPEGIAARGPCETHGCDRSDRCPTFHAEVSDHCPVTFGL
ncbi:MAG: endonuclease/exonuclease/phosphatase family protein [Sandaracinaceae bacterium]